MQINLEACAAAVFAVSVCTGNEANFSKSKIRY